MISSIIYFLYFFWTGGWQGLPVDSHRPLGEGSRALSMAGEGLDEGRNSLVHGRQGLIDN